VTSQRWLPVPVENGRMEPPPQLFAAPVVVRQSTRARDYFLVLLLMAVSGALGAGAVEYSHRERDNEATDASISLPAEVRLRVGEPVELQATTNGRRVCWLSLDRGLVLKPAGPRGVWLWGTRPGTYRLVAWSALRDTPTLNASASVVVGDEDEHGVAK